MVTFPATGFKINLSFAVRNISSRKLIYNSNYNHDSNLRFIIAYKLHKYLEKLCVS